MEVRMEVPSHGMHAHAGDPSSAHMKNSPCLDLPFTLLLPVGHFFKYLGRLQDRQNADLEFVKSTRDGQACDKKRACEVVHLTKCLQQVERAFPISKPPLARVVTQACARVRLARGAYVESQCAVAPKVAKPAYTLQAALFLTGSNGQLGGGLRLRPRAGVPV